LHCICWIPCKYWLGGHVSHSTHAATLVSVIQVSSVPTE
jgi:hypothetical protein